MLAQPKRKSKSVKKEKPSKHERSATVVKKIQVFDKVISKVEVDNTNNKVVQAEVADDNSNSKVNNPLSRDISIEGQVPLDTQIERGIMNLLEQEMSRVDKKQYPPRPQSLSFYEDEFGLDDTDLSGQLQALSPAEKQAIVNKYMTINANVDTNASCHDGDVHSLGSSREKIVSEQKKSKKHRKTKETTPKRSRRRNQSFFNEGYQPKTDITAALEDLQDDVFEGPAPIHGYNYGDSPKSPHYGGISPPLDIPTKIYIEDNNFIPKLKRNKMNERKGFQDVEGSSDMIPLDIAILLQRIWMPFTTFCHGLLAGVAVVNMMMLLIFKPIENEDYVMASIQFSEYYKTLFFILCVICVVSVFDRYDLAHLNMKHLNDLWMYRKSCVVIFIYLGTLASFLTETNRTGYYQLLDDKTVRILRREQVLLHTMGTSIGAILGWLIVSCSKYSDLLGIHLDNMMKFSEDGANRDSTDK